MSYLESKSLEIITSTVSSAKGRNLHIAPNVVERSPNVDVERDLIGKRSSLENYLATENYFQLFAYLLESQLNLQRFDTCSRSRREASK